MKKILMPVAFIAATVLAVSCDKNTNPPSNNVLRMLQAKWDVDTIYSKIGDEDSTYTGITGDYVDFRTDGKVYTSLLNVKDTSVYSLINNTNVAVDGDTALIKQLTSTQLVLEYKQPVAGDTLTTRFALSK